MPTVEHFLDFLEAVSRKDWNELRSVANNVVQYEREKKHFGAANRLREAINASLDSKMLKDSFVESGSFIVAPPIDLLKQENLENFHDPIMSPWFTKEISHFFNEWEFRDKLRKQNLYPRNTIILHGPPGCGKTMIAKYIAKKLGVNLYTVQFDALISSYLGETGTNIRKIFDFAASNRCILFIDEIDAVAKLRDDKSELGELKRVVITLLQNIDSFPKNSLLIAATNHAHMLDPAIWRRFEVAWEMLPPRDEMRIEFLQKEMGQYLNNSNYRASILKFTKGMSGAEMIKVIDDARKIVLLNSKFEMIEAFMLSTLEHIRRNERSKDADKKNFTAEIVKFLRANFKKKYTYDELENLTGISHSTLHNKVKVGKNG